MIARLTSILNPMRNPEPDALADPTLTASALVEEVHNAGIARAGIRLGAAGLVLFLLWASFAPVHEVAVGSGEVLPTGFVQNVQHLEGGMVEAVLVREGQQVAAGDPLLKLDAVAVRAELAKAEARAEAAQRDIARQRSVSASPTAGSGFAGVFTGDLFLRGVSDTTPDALRADDAYRQAQIEVVRAEIASRRAELDAMDAREQKTAEELDLIARQLADYDRALRSGAVSRRERDDVARDKIRMEADLAQIAGQRAATRSSLAEAEARERELTASFRQAAETALSDLVVQQAEARQSVAQLTDRLERTLVRAPVAGIVQQLGARNPGEVLAPGAMAALIVPEGGTLFAEVELAADQIGFVRKGMTANVKILTFDYTRFGAVTGTVEDISASSFKNERTGQPYYRVRLALKDGFVGNPDSGRRIAPGMSVSADILLGDKTVMTYLLKPLRALSDRAFSEQ